jgi:hypothetical protein
MIFTSAFLTSTLSVCGLQEFFLKRGKRYMKIFKVKFSDYVSEDLMLVLFKVTTRNFGRFHSLGIFPIKPIWSVGFEPFFSYELFCMQRHRKVPLSYNLIEILLCFYDKHPILQKFSCVFLQHNQTTWVSNACVFSLCRIFNIMTLYSYVFLLLRF